MLKRERLTIKVLPEQKEIIERIAKAEGESAAAVVRRLIREEAKKRGLWQSSRNEGTESCQNQ